MPRKDLPRHHIEFAQHHTALTNKNSHNELLKMLKEKNQQLEELYKMLDDQNKQRSEELYRSLDDQNNQRDKELYRSLDDRNQQRDKNFRGILDDQIKQRDKQLEQKLDDLKWSKFLIYSAILCIILFIVMFSGNYFGYK